MVEERASSGHAQGAAVGRHVAAQVLVRVQRGGTRRPVFFVAAGFGDVLALAALARCLEPDRPVYVLQPPTAAREPAPPDLPSLVVRYAAAVADVQPAGPYLLGGNSTGGLLALEVARRFATEGSPDGLVVLLDSPIRVSAAVHRAYSAVRGPFRRVMRWTRLGERALLRYVRAFFEDEGLLVHLTALRGHQAAPYAGRVVLFVPRHGLSLDWRASPRAWARIVRGELVVQRVPGGHNSMFRPPLVARLGERVAACLAASERESPTRADGEV
jgi:thioesterase domain-containing protein